MITLRSNSAESHVVELGVDAENDLLLGRGLYGLPMDPKIHRKHARVGWRAGACVVKNLGKNVVGVQREGGQRETLHKGKEWTQLDDGDQLCFCTFEEDTQGLRFKVRVIRPQGVVGTPKVVGISAVNDATATAQVAAPTKLRTNAHGSLLTHAQWGRVDPLSAALEEGLDPNSERFREKGAGPLHLACGAPGEQRISEARRTRRAECVSLLLEFNADPDLVDDIGLTPLHYAVSSLDQPEIVTALLQGGASATATATGTDMDAKMIAQARQFSESVAAIEEWEAQHAEDARLREAALDRAKTRFQDLDIDQSGRLDRDEIEHLSLWVFESFHPGGVPLTAEEKDKEVQNLLGKADDSGDGTVSQDEFENWFSETSQTLAQLKRSEIFKRQQALATSRAIAELDKAGELRKAQEAAERESLLAEAAEQRTTLETLEMERKSESKLLKMARKHFNFLDADRSGALEGAELNTLVQWIFTKFNPGDGPGSLSCEEEQIELKQLMKSFDTDSDGALTFDEFSAWFVDTTRGIHRKRRRLQATEESFSANSIQKQMGAQTQIVAMTQPHFTKRQEPEPEPELGSDSVLPYWASPDWPISRVPDSLLQSEPELEQHALPYWASSDWPPRVPDASVLPYWASPDWPISRVPDSLLQSEPELEQHALPYWASSDWPPRVPDALSQPVPMPEPEPEPEEGQPPEVPCWIPETTAEKDCEPSRASGVAVERAAKNSKKKARAGGAFACCAGPRA